MSTSPLRLRKSLDSKAIPLRKPIQSPRDQAGPVTAACQRPLTLPVCESKEPSECRPKFEQKEAEIVACEIVKNENADLKKANSRLKQELAARDKSLAYQKTQFSAKANDVIATKKKLRGLEGKVDEIERLKKELHVVKQQKVDAARVAGSRSQEIRELKAERDKVQAQLTKERQSPSSMSSLESELDAAKARIEGLGFEVEEAKAEAGVAQASNHYIARLNAMNHDLSMKYTAVVRQVNGMNSTIQEEKASADYWKGKHDEIADSFRGNDIAASSSCMKVTPPTSEMIIANSKLAIAVVRGVQTSPVPPSKHMLTSIVSKGVQTKPAQPVKPATFDDDCQPPTPLPDMAVIVNITPTNKATWSLTSRIQAVLSTNSEFEILGPPQLVFDLTKKMRAVEADHVAKKAKVLELRNILFSQARQIDRLEKAECNIKAHKSQEDQLWALEQKVAMQNGLLQDWGQQIAAFQRVATEKVAVKDT